LEAKEKEKEKEKAEGRRQKGEGRRHFFARVAEGDWPINPKSQVPSPKSQVPSPKSKSQIPNPKPLPSQLPAFVLTLQI